MAASVPAPAAVQALAGNIYNWLGRSGFPVAPFTTLYGIPDSPAPNSIAWGEPGSIFIDPAHSSGFDSVAGRYGSRGRLNPAQLEALRLMMHESLHQMRYGRTPGFYNGQATGTPGGYEEAATEAVTQDLLPIFAAKMYGFKLPGSKYRLTAYPEQVTNIRQLSTFGSGAKTYTDRAARVWRRSFLHATAEDRQKMVDAAQAARVRWGQETGR